MLGITLTYSWCFCSLEVARSLVCRIGGVTMSRIVKGVLLWIE
jgi:hypothetical protein